MRRDVTAALAVAIAAAFVYCPLADAPFLYDDILVIQHDPPVARLTQDGHQHNVDVLDHIWLAPRPLRQLTHRIEYRIAGPNPRLGHIVNIGLHLGCAAAGFLLLAMLGAGRSVALAAAALFLFNPVAVESVGIVSHRKEMLSTLFLLLGLSASTARTRRAFLLSFPCFLLATLGKETAVVFPALQLAILLGARFAGGGSPVGERLRKRLPAFALFAAALFLFAKWQISASMAYLGAAPSENPFRAGHFFKEAGWIGPAFAWVSAFPRYLASFAWPFGHCLDPVPFEPSIAGFLLCAVACGAFVAAVWFARRTRFFVPLVWIPVALSPYLLPTLVKSGDTAFFADHYAYLALPGFSWLLAEACRAAVRHCGDGRSLRTAATVALCAWFAVPAHLLCERHSSRVAFWSYVCRRNPGSPCARLNLADALARTNAPEESVEREFAAMAELAPDFVPGTLRYADYLCSRGRTGDALRLADGLLARSLRPRMKADVLFWRGGRLLSLDRRMALKDFEEARSLGCDVPAFHNSFGEALMRNLRWREARAEFLLAGKDPRFARSAARSALLVSDPPPRGTGRFMVVGDSVPNGFSSGIGGGRDLSLAERLSDRVAGASFRDATSPGSTAKELHGVLGRMLEREGAVDGCVIMTGHNDAFYGCAADDIALDIAECALAVRRAGAVPIVVGPIPVRDTPRRDRQFQERTLAELDSLLAGFCSEANVAFVSFREARKQSGEDVGAILVADEGNHLNDAGMELLAQAVATRFGARPIRLNRESP